MSEIKPNRFMIKKRTDNSVENQLVVSESEKPVPTIVSEEPTSLDLKNNADTKQNVEYKIINGIQYWYLNDKKHREDGPAVIWADGSQIWYKNGKRHREDGPAIIWADGSQEWWINGNRHREDGPVVIRADGKQEWWINGEKEKSNVSDLPVKPTISKTEVTESLEPKIEPNDATHLEPDATTWTENFAPERTTKSLEHEVDRLTKRLQRVENTINRSTFKDTRLNRAFTGQFGELVRTAVRNQDNHILYRLLDYADKHSSVKKSTETEQQNAQVSLQNNHELERQLESALETIEHLKMQQQNTEFNLDQYKCKYEELQKKYSIEEQSRVQEPYIIEQRNRAHRLLNEYRAKVKVLTNELTALKNNTEKYAIDELHDKRVQDISVSYEGVISGLNQKIADLKSELNTTKSVLDGIMKMVN